MTSSRLFRHSSGPSDENAQTAVLDYHACVRREGTGPPLVFVPGMDGTGQLFYRQIPGLARHFTVVTYALRDVARDMQALMDDLLRVIAHASPHGEPAVLVAESFGGALALSTAIAHPERVRALVVLNSFPFFRPQMRLRLALAGIRLMPWGAMRLVRRVTAFRLHSHHTQRADIKRFFELTAETTKRGYLSRLRILKHYDIREALRRLRTPVLFLAADQDHLIPSVSQARLMTSLAPGASMLVLKGHGHSCFLARSLELDGLLREWAPTKMAVERR